MALDNLAIANGALLRLGAKKISSLTEPGNDAATLCNHWIDRVRREALRAHPWNFALKRAQLDTYPQATLTPGAATGTGVSFTTNAAIFTEPDVEYRLVGATGWVARIKTYVSGTEVKADIEAALPGVTPVAAGQWRIAPAYGPAFRYAKPADYLRMAEVSSPTGVVSPMGFSTIWSLIGPSRSNTPDPFKIEGQYLVSDIGPRINVQYIADVSDPALWDDLCANAIESLLAFRVCYGVTGSLQAAKTQWDAYQAALHEARTADGQEGSADDAGSDVLIAVRR